MTASETMALAKAGLVLAMTLAGPLLLTSLIVGVAVGLVQALTQIQEMTLTFVPKIIAMAFVFLLCLPMIGNSLSTFMLLLSDLIIRG